jgi:hypothetical protein
MLEHEPVDARREEGGGGEVGVHLFTHDQ